MISRVASLALTAAQGSRHCGAGSTRRCELTTDGQAAREGFFTALAIAAGTVLGRSRPKLPKVPGLVGLYLAESPGHLPPPLNASNAL